MTPELCPRCEKPLPLCGCADVRELPTRISVLFLQHPQEPDKELGTARLASLCLPNSQLRVGLSWPNLQTALGRPADAKKWVALYLGSGVKDSPVLRSTTAIQLVSKNGAALPDSDAVLQGCEGLIVLDGTWSQAKTLWWRNAWLLKTRRGVLRPGRPSMYGRLRREPRRECLSTLESVGMALTAMGEDASIEEGLREVFAGLLARYRGPKPLAEGSPPG
jgi:DTW domain-containing protein YfiP